MLPEESDQSLAFLHFEETNPSNNEIESETEIMSNGMPTGAAINNKEGKETEEPVEADMGVDVQDTTDDDAENTCESLLSEGEQHLIEAAFEDEEGSTKAMAEATEEFNINDNEIELAQAIESQQEVLSSSSMVEAEMDDLVELVKDVDLSTCPRQVVDDDLHTTREQPQEQRKIDSNLLAAKLVSSFTVQTKTEKIASMRPKSASNVVDRLSKPKNTGLEKVLDASKSVILSSEEMVLAKIREEKKVRSAQFAKSRKVMSRMGMTGEFLCKFLISICYPLLHLLSPFISI